MCLHKCEQINFIAYFSAPHDGAANGLASAIYVVSYAILILKSILFFVHSSRWCFLRLFLPPPFNQPTNEMKTRAKVFLPYLFLPFFLARLLFALWQSSQKFCLASAISWRQLCVSPLTFAFVWIFRLFLPFSCIGESRKTAIKESLSMHFPSRSALN